MGVYLINFLVYSMAMVGLLFVCLMVYKKTMTNNCARKSSEELAVENAMNLSARKTLYIVKAGKEKFLIASDAERTTFLAKLNESSTGISQQISGTKDIYPLSIENDTAKDTVSKGVDYTEVMEAIKNTNKKQPVMKEILRKLEQQTPVINSTKE